MVALSQGAPTEFVVKRLITALSQDGGLGLRQSEEEKGLETDTSSFGDEEVLKGVPAYNGIS